MKNHKPLKLLLLVLYLCSASIGFADTNPTYSPDFFHDKAWEEAILDDENGPEWKNAIYTYRTLMVSNPEIYLQTDKFWINKIVSKFPGWGNDYLYRDRAMHGYEEIQELTNNGYQGNSKGKKFSWKNFQWENHIANAVSIDEQYKNNGVRSYHRWLDRKIPFIWSAAKGEAWQTDIISLAECLFLQMDAKKKQVWLTITDDGKAFVTEYLKRKKEIIIHDPLTGGTVELSTFTKSHSPVLILNDKHVWYPLMNRDDRSENRELDAIVASIAKQGASPPLDAFELAIRDTLILKTKINSKEENQWAFLFASRMGGEWSWRVEPILNVIDKYGPSQYREAQKANAGRGNLPYELSALFMMITEMSNRLSPLTAQIASETAQEQSGHAIFMQISEHYFQLFSNPNDYKRVYGNYNHIWVPTIEDKMVSKVGNCLVDATSVGSVLSLLKIIHPDWNVYITNWWSNIFDGGHVIAGIYSDEVSYSLSNGRFAKDSTTLRGPLFNYNNQYAHCLILKTGVGFLTTVEIGNNDTSKYEKPSSNMTRENILAMIEEIKTYEPNALFAVGDYGTRVNMNVEEFETYLLSQLQGHIPFAF